MLKDRKAERGVVEREGESRKHGKGKGDGWNRRMGGSIKGGVAEGGTGGEVAM